MLGVHVHMTGYAKISPTEPNVHMTGYTKINPTKSTADRRESHRANREPLVEVKSDATDRRPA